MMSERSLPAREPHDCIVESCEQIFDVTYGLAFRSADETPIPHLDGNMVACSAKDAGCNNDLQGESAAALCFARR